MKQQIYYYELFLFGKKKDDEDYIYLTQEQGQKLAMVLTTDPNRKFILIDDRVINTSAIEQLVKYEKTIWQESPKGVYPTGKSIKEIRELTPKEEETQRLFNEFKSKGQKFLTN